MHLGFEACRSGGPQTDCDHLRIFAPLIFHLHQNTAAGIAPAFLVGQGEIFIQHASLEQWRCHWLAAGHAMPGGPARWHHSTRAHNEHKVNSLA